MWRGVSFIIESSLLPFGDSLTSPPLPFPPLPSSLLPSPPLLLPYAGCYFIIQVVIHTAILTVSSLRSTSYSSLPACLWAFSGNRLFVTDRCFHSPKLKL